MGSNIILCLERHNDALVRFEDGPPFTLQRLCEILLDPKGTYTKLSKLALALEKEEQQSQKHTGAVDVEPERLPEHPAAVPNGTEHVGGVCDEEKADAEAVVSGRRDVEMQEDKPDQISNVNSDANSGGAVTSEAVNVREKSSDSQS